IGDDSELQSQPDTGSGLGQFDHEHHGGFEHTDGNLPHHSDRQRRRVPAKHDSYADGDGGSATQLCDFGFTGFPQCAARQPRQFDHHYHHQRRLQQRDHFVGFGSAIGNYGKLQSQPATGPGRGHLDHDHYGGLEHADGYLSHHGDRQRRRDPAEHYG